MKNNLLLVIFLLIGSLGMAQKKVTWDDMAKVEFTDKFFPEFNQSFLYPTFSDSVKALDGQKITLVGYFLDLFPDGNVSVLSKGPMSSCFFCGVGGPETAMELHFGTRPPFKMDDIIEVTGTLQLNQDDVNHFNYILRDCTANLAKQ